MASSPNDCWLIRCDVGQVVTIDVLSDDALLAIFDFYVVPYQDLDLYDAAFSPERTKKNIESWQLLVRVCRRWRDLVFRSPRRLNLQLFYEPGTSARKSLVWPALPLIIKGHVSETSVDNVIAELGHRDWISQINLGLYLSSRSQIENLWTAMQVPFPELAGLYMSHEDVSCAPVLPDSFLGGSALRLRYLALTSIPFPGLPNLLLSSTHLVTISLNHIPHSGYFSPEAMATCLSVLTSLRYLLLVFESPQSTPDQENRRSRSPSRSVLPSLTTFLFNGVNKYLEELVARIDTPRICLLSATLHDIDFDSPELIRFVSRSSTINAPNEAHVFFDRQSTSVRLQSQASNLNYFHVRIPWRVPGWQLSSPAQICTTSFPLLSTTENLFICEAYGLQVDWKDNAQNIQWLELLLPFTAVKNLYLSKQFAPHVVSALQEITGDGTTAVLSTLENLYLEGFEPSESVEEGIERFISARQLTNRPLAISVWEVDSRHRAYYI